MDTAVRIENRSQLIYLLTEAAELEHGIMCCYLFTTFTMKNDTSEGITDAQLKSIRRWKRLIRQVAIEEMLHMGVACNLLTAVGGAPQVLRPNLPTSTRAYGASFDLGLMPFSIETLEQFIAIEQPDLPEAGNGAGPTRQLPSTTQPKLSDIFSSESDYDTQGRLYRGIEDGVKYLAQKYGEAKLFIGPPEAQTTASQFGTLSELIPVSDLASALASIKIIVEQSEGASAENVNSHYAKFNAIRDEYKEILLQDPDFQPARPVLTNPYAIAPTDKDAGTEVNIVDDPTTADLCNLFDGCYELLIQILGRLLMHNGESDADFKTLAKVTEGLMIEILDPLGSVITTMPAGPSHPGMTAGPGFRLSRSGNVPTQREAAWSVFHERLSELLAYSRFLQGRTETAALTKARDALAKYADLIKAPA